MLLQCFELDRQTMTVPTRNILYTLALGELKATDDILENLVEGVTDVKATIGVRWTVMEDEAIAGRASAKLPSVEVIRAS